MHFRHRWATLSAKPMDRYYTLPTGTHLGDPQPITEVLQRCKQEGCEALRTITLDGRWTIGELTKEAT